MYRFGWVYVLVSRTPLPSLKIPEIRRGPVAASMETTPRGEASTATGDVEVMT
jgi:hypothetical protein